MTDLTITIGKISVELKKVYPGMKPWKIGRIKEGVETLLEKIQKNKYIQNIGGVERGHLYASEGCISIVLNPEKEKRIRVRFPDKDYIYELDKIQFTIRPPRSHREFVQIKVTGAFCSRLKYFSEGHEIAQLIQEEVVNPLIWGVERRRKKSDPQEWMRKEIKRLRGLTV